MMMKVILLTGATGFVGSHVARNLVRRGYEVHAVIRKSSNRERIADLGGQVHVWEGEMDHVPIDPDAAIHLAWITTPETYCTAEENRECLEASLRLLRKLPCRVVFAGTCFEFDTLGAGWKKLKEDSPTKPKNLYSKCKDDLRKAVVSRANSAWVRFFYLYGPWEHPRRRIPAAIRDLQDKNVVCGGLERRDYLHVADAARAVVDVTLSGLTGTVNIGSGESASMAEIVTKLGVMAGHPELSRVNDQPLAEDIPVSIVADNSKLRSTGWSLNYTLADGLAETVDWWRQRRME